MKVSNEDDFGHLFFFGGKKMTRADRKFIPIKPEVSKGITYAVLAICVLMLSKKGNNNE